MISAPQGMNFEPLVFISVNCIQTKKTEPLVWVKVSLVWPSSSLDNMDSPSSVLVWHCGSEFSDSGEPGVLKQSVYVRGLRSSSLSLSVLWLHATTQASMPSPLYV